MGDEFFIACELHDYIEIACMHGYRLKLTLKNGQILEGKAVDTLITPEKREYLILVDSSDQKLRIELIEIGKMKTISPNAVFKEITF